MYFLDASSFKSAEILSCLGIQASFKKPLVRKQSLDGSSPKACRSCTGVHGDQRGWLAKLLWNEYGNGSSLCNGAGLCSAPGEALSKPSRLLQKNPWVLFRFFLSCLHLLQLHPSVVLQILGFAAPPFSWPVWWCLSFCSPSFSQFTVALCHVLITW